MIRITSSTDHVLLASLNSEVQQLHHLMHPEIFKPFELYGIQSAIQAFLAEDNCKAFVAWDKDVPVGYMILVFRSIAEDAFHYGRHSLYIDQVGVPGKFRKQGIGELLLAHAEQLAREHGISRIELDHWTANTVAAKYFRKQGYALCREYLAKQIT